MSYKYEELCNNAYRNWRAAFAKRQYDKCNRICTNLINHLKPLYRENKLGSDSTFVYIFLILIKGLQDVSELVPMTKVQGWNEKHTENVWCKMWDARERLQYFRDHCLDSTMLDDIFKKLEELESYFYDHFGKGLYSSPDIIIKSATCSICNQDIKGCNHIVGTVYNGVPCKEVAQEISFIGVSIVSSPRDMRCRLWPWNLKEDRTISARIMNLSSIDDFLKNKK